VIEVASCWVRAIFSRLASGDPAVKPRAAFPYFSPIATPVVGRRDLPLDRLLHIRRGPSPGQTPARMA
jgi:hypothetical protein